MDFWKENSDQPALDSQNKDLLFVSMISEYEKEHPNVDVISPHPKGWWDGPGGRYGSPEEAVQAMRRSNRSWDMPNNPIHVITKGGDIQKLRPLPESARETEAQFDARLSTMPRMPWDAKQLTTEKNGIHGTRAEIEGIPEPAGADINAPGRTISPEGGSQATLKPMSARTGEAGPLKRFLGEESGSGPHPEAILQGAKDLGVGAYHEARELAQEAFPRTSDLSPDAANKLAAMTAARSLAQHEKPLIERKLFGTKKSLGIQRTDFQSKREADKFLMAATDLRLQYMKSRGYEGVSDVMNMPNRSFDTREEMQAFQRSPRFAQLVQKAMSPGNLSNKLDDLYRRSYDLPGNEDIAANSQIPGFTLPFVRTDRTAPVSTAAGRTRNPNASKLSAEAHGTGEYELRWDPYIERVLSERNHNVAKAEAIKSGINNNTLVASRPGQTVPGATLLSHNVHLPAPWADRGLVDLHVRDEAQGEYRRAFKMDEPIGGKQQNTSTKVVSAAANAITSAALAAGVDAVPHVGNNAVEIIPAPKRWIPVVKNTIAAIRGDQGFMEKVADLAGKATIPTKRTGWNVFGHFIDHMGNVVRVTLNDDFDSKVKGGEIKGTPEEIEKQRRDFNNQVGNYFTESQHKLVAALRQTKLGPFATATTTFTTNPIYKLFTLGKEYGLKYASPGQALKGRLTDYLGAGVAMLGAAFLNNYLLSGNILGAPGVPPGALQLPGKDDKTGKPLYVDPLAWIGARRALRALGINAGVMSARQGRPLKESLYHAAVDVGTTPLHVLGPPAQFAKTAFTGSDIEGYRKAEYAKGTPSQRMTRQPILNLKAAVEGINQLGGVALRNYVWGGKGKNLQETMGGIASRFTARPAKENYRPKPKYGNYGR